MATVPRATKRARTKSNRNIVVVFWRLCAGRKVLTEDDSCQRPLFAGLVIVFCPCAFGVCLHEAEGIRLRGGPGSPADHPPLPAPAFMAHVPSNRRRTGAWGNHRPAGPDPEPHRVPPDPKAPNSAPPP